MEIKDVWKVKLDTDRDGVPDFKDCKPFNPRYHSKTEFDEAMKYFGTTDDPQEAGWILPSGKMLDFSGKKFGHSIGVKRGMGHMAVQSILPESGIEAIYKFRKLGAIRFFKEQGGDIFASMERKPTREQAITLAKAVLTEPRPRRMLLARVRATGAVERDVSSLDTESPSPVLVQRFIGKSFVY